MTISEEKGLEILDYRGKICRENNYRCENCSLNKTSNLFTLEHKRMNKINICKVLSNIAIDLIQ